MPVPDRLACWIDHLGFFPMDCRTGCAHMLAYVALLRAPEVDWSCFHLKDPFFLCRWCKRR